MAALGDHSRMKRSFAGAALGALVLCLAACSMLGPKIEVPQLTLVRVAMMSADIYNQPFLVRLHRENPNDRELPIRGIDYKLFLEGDSFAEGLSNKPFTVPAKGETEFDRM